MRSSSARSAARRVEAEHLDVAGVGPAMALEDLHGGALAGAVGAEQAEDLSVLDLEADAAHRLVAVVGLSQAGNGDCSHARDRTNGRPRP